MDILNQLVNCQLWVVAKSNIPWLVGNDIIFVTKGYTKKWFISWVLFLLRVAAIPIVMATDIFSELFDTTLGGMKLSAIGICHDFPLLRSVFDHLFI